MEIMGDSDCACDKKEPSYTSGATKEDLELQAQCFRCELVLPDDSTLLIDMDFPNGKLPEQPLEMVNDIWGIHYIERWASKSGNTHFKVVLFGDIPVECREILQLALGSDSKRGILSAKTLFAPDHKPVEGAVRSCLFRPVGAIVERIV